MNVENAAADAPPQSEAAAGSTMEQTARARRRRKPKSTPAQAVESASSAPQKSAAPPSDSEVKPATPLAPVIPQAAVNPKPAPAPAAAARTVAVLPPPQPEQRKAAPPSKPKTSFVRRNGPLAAGMALALGLGAYAGTQLGLDRSETSARDVSVNVAAALPWKREVALASTQSREIGRLKEELRSVRTQMDALRSNPDTARQAQELRSLRASVENLKEGLTAVRGDTASAIAQVALAQPSKGNDRIERIAERLDRLEKQLADPTPVATLQKSEPPKQPAPQPDAHVLPKQAAPDPHALPTPADIAAAGQKVEIRPKVLQNYVLREVADGVALIEGPDGLREVWPGRGIPGAGKVTAIEKQAGKWVVITSEGLIEYRRDAYLRN
jgi:hypothetical protein